MGATTVWERWDSMLPDGTINPGEMTSFNHYALGAIADWMHQYVGGIRPLAPGYSKVLIAPVPGDGIDWAKTSLRSPHGTIAVEWRTLGRTARWRSRRSSPTAWRRISDCRDRTPAPWVPARTA